jgi:pimeloyl-ACP methyl ester carboxylesterase
VIIGDQDKAVPPDQQVKLADTIPNAKKIIYKGEGHMVTAEKQELVLKDILRFLDDVL